MQHLCCIAVVVSCRLTHGYTVCVEFPTQAPYWTRDCASFVWQHLPTQLSGQMRVITTQTKTQSSFPHQQTASAVYTSAQPPIFLLSHHGTTRSDAMRFKRPASHNPKQHSHMELQSYAVLGALMDPRSSQLDVTRRLRSGTLPATASKP